MQGPHEEVTNKSAETEWNSYSFKEKQMTIEALVELEREISLHSKEQLVKYAIVLEQQLEYRDTVLKLIPECLSHGYCLPHCIEWIKDRLEDVS